MQERQFKSLPLVGRGWGGAFRPHVPQNVAVISSPGFGGAA